MSRMIRDLLTAPLARMLRCKASDNNSTRISLESIARFLPHDPVIVEAGAHIGLDTRAMATFWPSGTVHAFEPVPVLYAKLQSQTEGLRNVCCYSFALGAAAGAAELHVSSGASDGSSSLLLPKEHVSEHPDVLFQESIEVRTITLDQWADQLGVSVVDFLWLDLQGYEFAVLKASPRILATVRAIHAEVSLKEMYQDAPLYSELRQWLSGQGFVVAAEELPWADMGNVLFVRKELLP